MKFDKRNPFAAWGHEQEIYTQNGGNGTIKLEQKGYTSLVDVTNSDVFVDRTEIDETAGKFTTPQKEVFFTNNENMNESLYNAKKMVPGEDTDLIRNTNEELPMYGIHADDWKLYEKNVQSEEDEPEQETPEQEEPEQDEPEQETPEQEEPEQEEPEQETPEQEEPEQETPEQE